jgi:hypothetical protein
MIKEMREFYYKNSAKEKTGAKMNKGTSRVDGLSIGILVRELQQLVFATPVYGIWVNPDADADLKLPDALPMRAFEWQAPDAPLDRVRLAEYIEGV